MIYVVLIVNSQGHRQVALYQHYTNLFCMLSAATRIGSSENLKTSRNKIAKEFPSTLVLPPFRLPGVDALGRKIDSL